MTDAPRVLVVDDQPDIRDLAVMVLQGAAYKVEGCASGDEALKRLAAESFELVLLDINMPGIDGWETLRMIRADEATAKMPVLMFSVKDEMRDKVQGMQEGADDYLCKPFAVDDLLARVGRLIDRSR
ncbi:MAG: response regulator [Acidobacteriota bacterium]|nr:response regulator [Acidobacteriota bacterium]MDH3784388.1 response regulator [Acidobacteriota bacterium]